MPTDKELADAYRIVAEDYYKHPVSESTGRGSFTSSCRKIADELDPPEPEWPDGTYARVCYGSGEDTSVSYVKMVGGEWCHANGLSSYELRHEVTKVEPLRVLADDEIAVKRQWVTCPASSWRYEAKRCMDGSPVVSAAAGLCNAYADALEAEEAQAKP